MDAGTVAYTFDVRDHCVICRRHSSMGRRLIEGVGQGLSQSEPALGRVCIVRVSTFPEFERYLKHSALAFIIARGLESDAKCQRGVEEAEDHARVPVAHRYGLDVR